MRTGRRGPTSRSPTLFRAAPRPSRTFANDACCKGSSRRWNASGGSPPRSPNCSTAEQEAQIIALRLGLPPKGYANWSLRLLARRVVELAIVESVSRETIRRTLKKTG